MEKLNKKGFTLVEILVVVLIISILSAIALPKYFVNVELARAREAIDYARMWQGARNIYFAQNEAFPPVSSTNLLSIEDFSNAKFFDQGFVSQDADSYSFFLRKTGAFAIKAMAESDELFCCWPTQDNNTQDNNRGQKICETLASGSTQQNAATYSAVNYSCKEIIEGE